MPITSAKKRQIASTVTRLRAAKTWRPVLHGSSTKGHHPREVSALALRRGAAVELEHTDNVRLAVEIAFGHILERADYYPRLEKVEG